MPIGPQHRQPADPGTPRSRRITLIAAVVLSLVLIGLQNVPPLLAFFESTQETPAAAAEAPAGIVPPQPGDPVNTLGRMFIKMREIVRHDPEAMPTIDRFSKTQADRLRAAVVAGELHGDAAARERLNDLVADLDGSGPIARDALDLLPIYAEGPDAQTPGRARVDPDSIERLRRHHGYYADVALTRGLPDDHPDRAPLLDGGFELILVSLGALVVIGLALLSGTVLLGVGLVRAWRGRLRPRMSPPEPGGSVYLEVYVLFVGGFLLLKLTMGGVSHLLPNAGWLTAASILLQWCLLAVVFWPRLRGVGDARHADAMGWHAGSGFWREAGFGVLGYLAGLPVYLAGLLLTMLAMLLATLVREMFIEGPPPVPNQNLFDIFGESNAVELALFMSLAVLWAPLCEESVFRGALFRHLRGRWRVPAAALGSATLFGFMHGYGPLFVFPLIALGSVFAVMREWRGSLIAPVTAHMLHNATVTVLLLVMIRFLA